VRIGTGPPAGGRPRGRPRSEQAERAILRATLELLAEGQTIAGLSMEAVAARAAVGKATIYRRWPSKESLIIDALAAIKDTPPGQEPPPEREPGGSVRDELILYVDRIRRRNTTPEGRILPAVIAELKRHPELFEQYQERVIEPRRELVRRVLRRGIASGELRPDLDIELAQLMLVGPMLFLTLVEEEGGIAPDLSARMVDAALHGLRAP
jgi:AcrR family transcriptional regulator